MERSNEAWKRTLNLYGFYEDDRYPRLIVFGKNEIVDMNIVVPEKVIEVQFGDSKKIKSVCDEKDEFSMYRGVMMCVTKHEFKDKYRSDKLEQVAEYLSWLKEYDSKVRKAINKYNEKIALAEKTEKKLNQTLLVAEKQRAKAEHEAREKEIEIQAAAIIRANKVLKKMEKSND